MPLRDYIFMIIQQSRKQKIKPSQRGIEITSLNNLYLKENNLNVEIMGGYCLA